MTAPRNIGEQIRFQKRTQVRAGVGVLIILIGVEYFFVWILLSVKSQTDWGGLLLFLEVVTVAIVFVRLIFSSRERHLERGDTHLPRWRRWAGTLAFLASPLPLVLLLNLSEPYPKKSLEDFFTLPKGSPGDLFTLLMGTLFFLSVCFRFAAWCWKPVAHAQKEMELRPSRRAKGRRAP
jgi:hypothetical protein